MKKILLFILVSVTLAVTTPVFAASPRSAVGGAQERKPRSIMELPLFERAVLIIKKFETLHQLRHRPYYQKYNVIQSNIDYEHVYHCTPIYL